MERPDTATHETPTQCVLWSFVMSRPRIYIVAGPRSCGKSTFIDHCKAAGSALLLPEEVSGLVGAHGPVYYMDLAGQTTIDSRDLLVDVDLLTPFVHQTTSSEQQLVSMLQPQAFSEFPGASLFDGCAKLTVLTLRVPRNSTLRRWLRRSVEQGRDSVRTVIAQLYSDALGEAGYSRLYDAWDQYITGLPNATRWNIFEARDSGKYSVVRAR